MQLLLYYYNYYKLIQKLNEQRYSSTQALSFFLNTRAPTPYPNKVSF